MRVLYLDIDSLRPDHLGCYGYHRATSPNIDRVAAQGVRFENVHAPDAPCLPSRTALWSGRHGIHTGVINHGGVAAEPFIEGPERRFRSRLGLTSWMHCLRQASLLTATVSPFGERHSAWHWYASFNEIYNTGKSGMERADEISPVALDWIARNGRRENWFLHVNLWDPHTPYRTPESFGEPFAGDPLPAWLTEEVRQAHWAGCGPHSAREIPGYVDDATYGARYPRQPVRADSMAAVRQMFDGYDTGVRYADEQIGQLLNALADQGVLDETVIMISADHGENLGELNIYGDHQTADQITTRVPLIVRWPGIAGGRGRLAGPEADRTDRTDRTDRSHGIAERVGRVDPGLYYSFDFAAAMIELLGGKVPSIWDGESFAAAFRRGEPAGREYLVVSQGAWSCQRSVRWGDYLCIRSYHDGYHGFPDVMLFNVREDPHEQRDLAPDRPELVGEALRRLDDWYGRMLRTATHALDPMSTVLQEGGPLHTRGELPRYLERLRATDREAWAERLAARHPREI